MSISSTTSRALFLCLLSLVTSRVVEAAFDLQVSEIWPGQSGSDVTEDWFEIVNMGDETYTAATDGNLYYMDDRTFDPTDVVEITGITSLAPKAVAIVLIGDVEDETDVRAEFAAEWPNVSDDVVIGYAADGKGLGQDEDGVQLWVSVTAPTADPADIIASYAHTTVVDGASYLPMEMAFSMDGVDGATKSTSLGGDDGDTPEVDEADTAAVASPGFVPGLDTSGGDCLVGFVCDILDFFSSILSFWLNLLPF